MQVDNTMYIFTGYCEVRGDQAICICKSGTTGEYCEKNVCTVNPCKNGGKCIHDDSGYNLLNLCSFIFVQYLGD